MFVPGWVSLLCSPGTQDGKLRESIFFEEAVSLHTELADKGYFTSWVWTNGKNSRNCVVKKKQLKPAVGMFLSKVCAWPYWFVTLLCRWRPGSWQTILSRPWMPLVWSDKPVSRSCLEVCPVSARISVRTGKEQASSNYVHKEVLQFLNNGTEQLEFFFLFFPTSNNINSSRRSRNIKKEKFFWKIGRKMQGCW